MRCTSDCEYNIVSLPPCCKECELASGSTWSPRGSSANGSDCEKTNTTTTTETVAFIAHTAHIVAMRSSSASKRLWGATISTANTAKSFTAIATAATDTLSQSHTHKHSNTQTLTFIHFTNCCLLLLLLLLRLMLAFTFQNHTQQ